MPETTTNLSALSPTLRAVLLRKARHGNNEALELLEKDDAREPLYALVIEIHGRTLMFAGKSEESVIERMASHIKDHPADFEEMMAHPEVQEYFQTGESLLSMLRALPTELIERLLWLEHAACDQFIHLLETRNQWVTAISLMPKELAKHFLSPKDKSGVLDFILDGEGDELIECIKKLRKAWPELMKKALKRKKIRILELSNDDIVLLKNGDDHRSRAHQLIEYIEAHPENAAYVMSHPYVKKYLKKLSDEILKQFHERLGWVRPDVLQEISLREYAATILKNFLILASLGTPVSLAEITEGIIPEVNFSTLTAEDFTRLLTAFDDDIETIFEGVDISTEDKVEMVAIKALAKACVYAMYYQAFHTSEVFDSVEVEAVFASVGPFSTDEGFGPLAAELQAVLRAGMRASTVAVSPSASTATVLSSLVGTSRSPQPAALALEAGAKVSVSVPSTTSSRGPSWSSLGMWQTAVAAMNGKQRREFDKACGLVPYKGELAAAATSRSC